jgi:hypothetical protein
MSTPQDDISQIKEFVEQIAPTLLSQEPHIVSGVLCDLIAMHLVGYRLERREKILHKLLTLVSTLTAHYDEARVEVRPRPKLKPTPSTERLVAAAQARRCPFPCKGYQREVGFCDARPAHP